MSNKIVLIGYMGVGKTTLAKELSKKLELSHHDLDDFIEKKVDLEIKRIFSLKGEIYFRRLERDCLEELIKNDESIVLSVGGGTPCYYENYKLLEGVNIVSIYLKASINTLVQRLKSEKIARPLISQLSDEEITEFIGKHLFERSYYYNKAKHTVSIDEKSTEEIINEILDLLS